MYTKLTDQQLSKVWDEIRQCQLSLKEAIENKDARTCYIVADDLRRVVNRLHRNEVALTIEQGNKATA